ncbi:MAG: hypothetical protein K2O89_05150 [Clostridia bacterium]|nr:hypothetical protein [Clostridia bacterium]
MTLKEKKEFNKNYCPAYYRGHSLKVSLPIIIWTIIGCGAVAGIAFSDYEDYTVFAVLVFLVGLFVIGISVGVASYNRTKRLVCEREAELNAKFSDTPLEEAEKVLLQKNVITEHGFVANEDAYAGKQVVPLNEIHITFYSSVVSTEIFTVALIADSGNNVIARYIVDNPLYNYILKKGIRCTFYGDTDVLLTDRSEFVRKNLNIDKTSKYAYVLFGVFGSIMHDNSVEKTTAKRTVLDLLKKSTAV